MSSTIRRTILNFKIFICQLLVPFPWVWMKAYPGLHVNYCSPASYRQPCCWSTRSVVVYCSLIMYGNEFFGGKPQHAKYIQNKFECIIIDQ